MAKKSKSFDSASALFVPGFLLAGMGFGFLFDQLVAGLFIGLGLGLVALALANT